MVSLKSGAEEVSVLINGRLEDDATISERLASPEGATNHRVLVVSSDLSERRSAKELLRDGVNRCKTYGAASGEEALSLVERMEVDCVLLSEYIPDFRDLELIGHLTSCTTLAALPVIVLGESTSYSAETAAREAGAVAYLANATQTPELLCSTVTHAIAHDRLLRVIEMQSRQIKLLGDERNSYISRTDELAHDLLTPLAVVQEFVSLVFDGVSGPIKEEQRKHLAYARGGCDAIRTSVESLIVNRDLEQILTGAD